MVDLLHNYIHLSNFVFLKTEYMLKQWAWATCAWSFDSSLIEIAVYKLDTKD